MRIAACLACRRHSIAAAFAISLAAPCPYVAVAHENKTYRIVDAQPGHVAAAGWGERFVRVDAGASARQRDRAPAPAPVATPPPLVDGGATVTLWDEIGPPAPLPMPSNARMIHGDGVSYTRQ
ncbi:hypothetical protein BTI_1150 [Burkholderia thailandensis MSMB121]|uniref:Uncharacterized protein n=2 Tax=Burkholderia humptydooensis TaxID=430531 RepID=A0A7U4P2W7_9BURK|nr:hypothetical protein BTI_1150 [Burkholderia thailandensis MSMB121]AJY42357.1 hypothetical protein BW21_1296 [Burkholderia sp. 2002721687]ALX41999.1 hypothetical protein AQ610_05855 [Burkholderia humptydooensis]KVN05522.1 hypothetical protein WT08_21390 [Burkholderia sp. MSMB1552]KWZ56535.1 hypothetical protein WS92_11980 [Burkholderia sp. MSMB1588]